MFEFLAEPLCIIVMSFCMFGGRCRGECRPWVIIGLVHLLGSILVIVTEQLGIPILVVGLLLVSAMLLSVSMIWVGMGNATVIALGLAPRYSNIDGLFLNTVRIICMLGLPYRLEASMSVLLSN